MKSEKQQAAQAKAFAERWAGRGYEKGESQVFWTELLTEVYGVENPSTFIRFEQQAQLDNTSFIDVVIPSTKVMIEQKSLGKDLRKPIRQSDGSMLNPFQQAQRYMTAMPVSQHPRWIVTCNFAEFDVYDMENPKGEPQRILLKDLGKEYYRLQFLLVQGNEHLKKELEVSMKAGEIVGKLYDALLGAYGERDKETLRCLNILCVRLVFCLYAEDAGIFGSHDMFHDYLSQFPAKDMRRAMIDLFQTLNTPEDKRSRYLDDDLKAFPYTNGGLFAEEIEIPQFTDDMRDVLLSHASLDFDWSEISPTIFGGVFESTLNPETRRSGGMHYTSIENIHKVIDPLFLDGLRRELAEIEEEKVIKKRNPRLKDFQRRLASLKFFDPACGSGNFLTETFISLRRLENEVIKLIYGSEQLNAFDNPIKVSINQFYGIEINDFAVEVATTALWISEAQMLAETERIISQEIDFLPLKSYANIHEGNSLTTDWLSIINASSSSAFVHPPTGGQGGFYIIGNPPFVGARLMSESQKEDVVRIFGSKWKNVGNLDYVCCWYRKAAEMMKGTRTRAALVSTNSVSQGEQVANLWAPLMAEGLTINFAHRTFRWDSEANLKAHVHCVIIGFSYDNTIQPLLFDGEQCKRVGHINPYLVESPDTFIYSRSKPLADVPNIGIGNKPIDGGNYLFEKEEMEAFIKQEPLSAPLFHKWYGSEEFIHQRPRYCLWLGDCSPAEIQRMPHCKKRVENVRELRLQSKSEGTRKLADKPTRFHVENMPDGASIIIPSVSSERRKYVPMGFIEKGVFASNLVLIIPNATLYHFGILESNVHMAWMRAVCGRLKSDYRYSKDIVYNNFPWPSASGEQLQRIEQTAQSILDVRVKYPESSLAVLYDPVLMPADLRKAHQDNDRAVMQAYGFSTKMTESECVAALFEMYAKITTT